MSSKRRASAISRMTAPRSSNATPKRTTPATLKLAKLIAPYIVDPKKVTSSPGTTSYASAKSLLTIISPACRDRKSVVREREWMSVEAEGIDEQKRMIE